MPQPVLTILLLLVLAHNVMAKVETSIPAKASTDAAEPKQQPVSRQPPQPRGEMLYTNHCLSCHESLVHIREKRHAKNLDAVRDSVMRWSQQLELNWSADEIEDVVLYLNMRYYHYTE